MSRSRKSRKHTRTQRPAKQRPENLPTAVNNEALEEKAQAALEAGRHKDAIVHYKTLLKVDRRGEWLTGLARAYASRASELADKGMFKEALVIWEQRTTSCNTPLLTCNYVVWTLQSGNLDSAVTLFNDLPDDVTSKRGKTLISEYFAAFALTGDTRILGLLPAVDPVVRDHASANALLTAFCAGDISTLETHLKAIAHRSPYREFRQIIKAWHLEKQTPGGLSAALSRIGKHSPFLGLANTLLDLHSPESQTVIDVRQDISTLTLKAAFNGWSGKQIELIKAAGALGPAPNAKALFNLLVRYAAAFEAPCARKAALRLLVHYPQGQQGFAKHFGKLSPLEVARFEAQMAEMEGDPYEADSAWREVLDKLVQQSKPGDDRLREALVLRKLASQWLAFERNEYPQPKVVEDLTNSLTIDPDDLATHLQLIDLQRKSNDLKGARASVKQALDRFPDNTAILVEAVHIAIDSEAFKKAASIAQQILKLDPINVKVQSILLNAHLAHGRKQIRTGKFDLARRELLDAASWARTPETQGRVKLIRGFLEYAAQEPAQGQSLLKEGVTLSGGKLVGQYQLLIEAQKLDMQRQNWLKITALPKAKKFAGREAVLDLVRAVGHTRDLEDDDIYGTIMEFEAVIRKSVKEPYTLPEMELICETLHRYGVMRLLEKFAQRALELWPRQTVFVFHSLFAKANGVIFKLSEHDQDRLASAIDQAQSDGDSRTVHRIIEFMEPPRPFGFSPGFPKLPPGLPADMVDELPAALAALLDEVGPGGLAELFEAMERDLENGEYADSPLEDLREPARPRRKKKRAAKYSIPNSDQKDLF